MKKKHPRTIKSQFLDAEASDLFDEMAQATVSEWDEAKHRKPSPEEVALINSLRILSCPHCGSADFSKWGKTSGGVRRFMCGLCGKTFGPLTGTLFDHRRIPESEWIEYLIGFCAYESVRQSCLTNMNAASTGRYWNLKVFAACSGIQDGAVLSGRVWIDETYFADTPSGLVMIDGKKLRGISRNCLCVATACDSAGRAVLLCCGRGKPSGKRILEALGPHIAEGSHVIHDGENSHGPLIKALKLSQSVHPSSETKGLSDRENPMEPINAVHRFLKKFMARHGGFDRDYLQDWLNAFHLVYSCKGDSKRFVKTVLQRAVSCRKVLRYRVVMAKKHDESDD